MGTEYQQRAKSRTQGILGLQMGLNQQKAESAANLSDNAGDLMNSANTAAGMIAADKARNPYRNNPGTIEKTGNFAPMTERTPLLGIKLDNELKQ